MIDGIVGGAAPGWGWAPRLSSSATVAVLPDLEAKCRAVEPSSETAACAAPPSSSATTTEVRPWLGLGLGLLRREEEGRQAVAVRPLERGAPREEHARQCRIPLG
eukprot:scaffold3353_cov63-Phaeocystis_antarctica.AAC.4